MVAEVDIGHPFLRTYHWDIRACYLKLSENLHVLIIPVNYAMKCGA